MVDPDTGEISPAIIEEPPPVPVGGRAGALNGVFNYDTAAVSLDTGLRCLEPTLTQQQFRDESDINTIVRNFGLTGQLPEQGAYPAYGDFDGVTDYHKAMNIVRLADEAFNALPGDVRARFSNDPQMLMQFCEDPANLPEARKLGLTRTLTEPYTPVKPGPVAQVGVPAKPEPLAGVAVPTPTSP